MNPVALSLTDIQRWTQGHDINLMAFGQWFLKGENAGNWYFLLIRQSFQPYNI